MKGYEASRSDGGQASEQAGSPGRLQYGEAIPWCLAKWLVEFRHVLSGTSPWIACYVDPSRTLGSDLGAFQLKIADRLEQLSDVHIGSHWRMLKRYTAHISRLTRYYPERNNSLHVLTLTLDCLIIAGGTFLGVSQYPRLTCMTALGAVL